MDYTELAYQFLQNMYDFQRSSRQKQIDETMRGEGFALLYISRQEGSVLPGDISSAMNISTARIAAALNSMENKGLITRRIDKEDRRRILVELTEAGRRLAAERDQMALSHTKQMLELLGESDAKALVRILRRLSELAPGFHHTE